MFLFFTGSVVGFFVGFFLFVAIILTDIKFDATLVTNIIIAVATVVATAIHFNSVRQQRKDRLWDINKPILLELSHTLSLVIRASEFYLQQECAKHHTDDAPQESEAPSGNVFKDFKEKQEYALNVYKALMGKELVAALEQAKRINENIDHGVNEYGVDPIAAYEESIETNKKLQKKLDFFIAKMSGVNDI